MNLFTVLRNIYLKIQKNINVERITNSEIDDAFGEAAGTGTDAQDYVVEHGTSGIWTYRKWASGIAECWGTKEYDSINVNNSWGNNYTGTASTPYATYPNGLFVAAPICTITADSNTYNYALSTRMESGAGSSTQTPSFQCLRPTIATGVGARIFYHAIGKWK